MTTKIKSFVIVFFILVFVLFFQLYVSFIYWPGTLLLLVASHSCMAESDWQKVLVNSKCCYTTS